MSDYENLIHVKLENEEAFESKREILISEGDFLRIMQSIKGYHNLRSKELNTKIILYNRVRSLMSDIRKTQGILPKIEIPKILQKEEDIKTGTIKIKRKKKKYGDEIESQLQEIQDKLDALQKK